MTYGRDDYEEFLRRREERERQETRPKPGYFQRGVPFRELERNQQLFPSPSGLIWICFIGGPLHLTEKVYPNKEFKTARHRFMMQTFGPISPTMQDFTLVIQFQWKPPPTFSARHRKPSPKSSPRTH